MSFNIKDAVCFDDVLLVPKYSEVESRKYIDISSSLCHVGELTLPIISSPMDTVTESTMVTAMHNAGGVGIIHRYNTIEDQVAMVHDICMSGVCRIGAAIGASGDYVDRATALYDAGAKIFCVDIAHGHHVLMRRALHTLRDIFGDEVHIMAGNVATLEAFNDLADWGADSIRVGIGGGSICSTRIQTGHGAPTLQSIIDCAKSHTDASLIADGGIRNSGDIVKALAAGADFVMIGSLLAGTSEAPGSKFYHPQKGSWYKTYRGMASVEAQVDWRGHTSSVEGVATAIECKGSVDSVLEELERGIRSGLSYSGASSIRALQNISQFIRQSGLGLVESETHIFRK